MENEKYFRLGNEWKLSYVEYDGVWYERWERLCGKRYVKWKSENDGWLDGRWRIPRILNKMFDQHKYWEDNVVDVFRSCLKRL